MPGDGAAGAGDGVVRDSRFKTLHNDPRFMNFPAATNKTKIDGRFAKMFSDPNFGTGARGNRDKRGRSCLLYISPSPRDRTRSRMPSSA